MKEFQLTHVALVGARMLAFKPYGFHDRNQLAMRVVIPEDTASLAELPTKELPIAFKARLPLWVHNIIYDPRFPQREKLLMPLRRFEGELLDSKQDEVVAWVLSAGFRNQELDPLNLPAGMPMRQRCAIVMQVAVWQEAYRTLEQDLVTILSHFAEEIAHWSGLYQTEDTRWLAME